MLGKRHEIDAEKTRLLIVSDAHGFRQPLAGFEARARLDARTQVIFTGDMVRGGPWPHVVTQWVMEHAGPLAVRGNHDDVMLAGGDPDDSPCTDTGAHYSLSPEQRDYVRSLPHRLELHWRGARIVCWHGHVNQEEEHVSWLLHPDEQSAAFPETGADLCVLSHTHHPHVLSRGSSLVANTGSLSLVASGVRQKSGMFLPNGKNDLDAVWDVRGSYLSVTSKDGGLDVEIVRFDFDREGALADLEEAGATNMAFHRSWLLDGIVDLT